MIRWVPFICLVNSIKFVVAPPSRLRTSAHSIDGFETSNLLDTLRFWQVGESGPIAADDWA